MPWRAVSPGTKLFPPCPTPKASLWVRMAQIEGVWLREQVDPAGEPPVPVCAAVGSELVLT